MGTTMSDVTVFPRVQVEQARSSAWATTIERAREMVPVNPEDASLALAVDALRRRGMTVTDATSPQVTVDTLRSADVYVIPHLARAGVERVTGDLPPVYSDAELDAIEQYVRGGGGLVVLAECDTATSGSNLGELLARFGVTVESLVVQEAAGDRRFGGNATWIRSEIAPELRGQGLVAGVDEACFYRSGVLDVGPPAAGVSVLARTSESASPAGRPLAAALQVGLGRVVVFADSDLFGDDSIDDFDQRTLWTNVVTWASGAHGDRGARHVSAAAQSADWGALKAAVTELRALQAADGSVVDAADHARAGELVETIVARIAALAPLFAHDADYLAALPRDFRRWVEGGFGKPLFDESLAAFRPDLERVDGAEHLVVFPMYTQNGNAGKVFEAVLLSVVWPTWLADVEQRFDNGKFLAVAFEDFTAGYDTDSAVLFPETVTVEKTPEFHWGAIFCDREAARFRRVTGAAAEVLSLQLPPDGERLVASQALAQSTFAMWDLIHDRTHSRGDLPFDPFMIKQRMPYWLYALEELRCDLTTFREAYGLQQEGHPYGLPVQLAILCDRLFRFTITGTRVRNYDGLGGQLLFAYLHRHGALRWRDNRLSIDWKELPLQVIRLAEEIEELYRTGIDRSKVGQWLASYQFVSSYVVPAPGATWAKGPEALPLDGEPRALVDLVLPDEFPLNVFFEALRRKVGGVVDSTRGITADADPVGAGA
ncbi:hypothetical protein TPAU25S_01277 [Tsukamurella paurometabola]|uniref:DUF4350 domain-containing protein n=2 Tax=Tsukamurella paurometabola TaxID=2061 RepID=D5UUI2_TSUPD|nr:conserved hypothetical protein [Tsukamurella paurometabola DSM 20162]SUP27681.1 Uncharacterised protein [Tsukamurella paurometabola]